jgi:hypothetical protein
MNVGIVSDGFVCKIDDGQQLIRQLEALGNTVTVAPNAA